MDELFYNIHISNIHGFTMIEPVAEFDNYEEAHKEIGRLMLEEYKRYKDADSELDEEELQNIVNHSYVMKTNDESLGKGAQND